MAFLSRLRQSGQLRFRAETFGVFYPANPDQRAWWRMSPRSVLYLARATLTYANWMTDMSHMAKEGPASWWARHGPTLDAERALLLTEESHFVTGSGASEASTGSGV